MSFFSLFLQLSYLTAGFLCLGISSPPPLFYSVILTKVMLTSFGTFLKGGIIHCLLICCYFCYISYQKLNCWKCEYCFVWRSFLHTMHYLSNWLMSVTIPIITFLKEIKKTKTYLGGFLVIYLILQTRIYKPLSF